MKLTELFKNTVRTESKPPARTTSPAPSPAAARTAAAPAAPAPASGNTAARQAAPAGNTAAPTRHHVSQDRVTLSEESHHNESGGGFNTSALLSAWGPEPNQNSHQNPQPPKLNPILSGQPVPGPTRVDPILTGNPPADVQTVKSEDGVNTLRDAQGREYTQSRYTKDGTEHVQTTAPDGTRHDYVSTSMPDGSTQIVHEQFRADGSKSNLTEIVHPDGRVERTTQDTTQSNQSFSQVAGPGAPDLDKGGPVEQTTTRAVVIEGNPPQEKVVSTGRLVTQSAPIDKADNLGDARLDTDRSRVKYTYAEETHYDDKGQAIPSHRLEQDVQVVGRRSDGREVSAREVTTTDGQTPPSTTEEYRGFTRDELKKQSSQGLQVKSGNSGFRLGLDRGAQGKTPLNHLDIRGEANDYLNQQDPIDIRVNRNSEGESIEYGQLDGDQDGRKITRVQGKSPSPGEDGPVIWNYHQQSNHGNRIADQTVREGDQDFSSTSVLEKQGDGSFHYESKTRGRHRDGQVIDLHTQTADRRPLRAEDLDRYAREVGLKDEEKQALAAQLRSGQPVFVTTSNEQFTSPDLNQEKPDTVVQGKRSSTSIAGAEGQVYSQLNEENRIKLADGSIPTLYKRTRLSLDPQAEQPLQFSVDRTMDQYALGQNVAENQHISLKVGRDGQSEFHMDDSAREYYAKLEQLDTISGGPKQTSAEETGDLLEDSLGPAAQASGNYGDIAGRAPGAFRGFAGIIGAGQIFHGLQEGDGLKVANGVNSALPAVGGLAESFLARTNLATLGKVGGTVLGTVGNAAGIAAGTYQIVNGESTGDKVRGGFDVLAGGLGILALAGGPAAGPLAVGALAVTLAGWGYDWVRDQVGKSDPAPIDQQVFNS